MRIIPILSIEQLQCLVSPARADVFEALRSMGRASAAEVGSRTGKSAATAHYHLRKLLGAGLVHIVERRPTDRKPEAVFAPVSKRWKLPEGHAGSAVSEAARETVLAGIRGVTRAFEAASRDGEFVEVSSSILRLSPDDMKRFSAMLNKAAEFARSSEDPNAEAIRWHSVLVKAFPGSSA